MADISGPMCRFNREMIDIIFHPDYQASHIWASDNTTHMGDDTEFVPWDFCDLFRQLLADVMASNTNKKVFDTNRFWKTWRKLFVNAGYTVRKKHLLISYIFKFI